MTTIPTLNVSRDQIEQDLRAGKTVEEIADAWSEPRANVYAVQRAMRDHPATPTPPTSPLRAVPGAAPAKSADEDPPLLSLVDEASRSASQRTRGLGAKLDQLVEELTGRLVQERADKEAREAKERAQAEARAEVERLEAQLRAARERARGPRTSPTKTADNPRGSKSTKPAYDGGPTSSVIRAWAGTAGVDCPPHGQLPQRVITAYREAHGDA